MHLIIAFAILSLEERESRREALVTINQSDEIKSDLRCDSLLLVIDSIIESYYRFFKNPSNQTLARF